MFEEYLKCVEDKLDIPFPERKLVLGELEAHLEALYFESVKTGTPAHKAREHAIVTLALDQNLLGSLDNIHRTCIANALARLPSRVALGIEYACIGLIGLALILNTLWRAPMIQLMLDGGVFMIPINVAGIAIIVLSIERFYSLFIKRDHSTTNLERCLLSLKFLAVACTLTGLLGTAMGFFQAFAAADRIGQPFPIFEVARIALTTTIVGMTLSLVAVTIHFVVKAKVSRISAMQVR
ncbi:MotA/TolQ/ExbB proton channel family protein [Myxococcota bacterium]